MKFVAVFALLFALAACTPARVAFETPGSRPVAPAAVVNQYPAPQYTQLAK